MRLFLVFTCPTPDGFGDYFPTTLARHRDGVSVVVVDNDSSPELASDLLSIAGTMNDLDAKDAKVHRIERTPLWKIAEDILTGSAAAGITEPTVIAAANHVLRNTGIEVAGLLGPKGSVTENFLFTENPVELMATLMAKAGGAGGLFAPSMIATGNKLTRYAPLRNAAVLMGVDAESVKRDAALGERPPAVHASLANLYRGWFGDEPTDFLVRLQAVSQIADDFVDDAMPAPWRSDAMRELLETAFLEIPNHPFYVANKATLEEAVAQCITLWHLSNGLEACTTAESRMWCFVQREAFQMVVWRVAVIVGGLALGRDVLAQLQQFLHGPNGGAKKFPEWLEESRVRSCRG